MASSNSTDIPGCEIAKIGTFQIILMLVTLPLHAILIKILTMDFQLNAPRHVILRSICLSDALLVCSLSIIGLVNKVITINVYSTGCMIYRAFAIFISCLALVVSSLSITAITAERYIACIHSYQRNQIFTDSRVRCGSIIVWMLGVLIGIVAVIVHRYDDELIIPNRSVVQYMYLIFVIPPSISIASLEVRLFLFIRKVRIRITPAGSSNAELKRASDRRRQLMIAFSTASIALLFLLCTVPLASVFVYELLSGKSVSLSTRDIFFGLSFCNSLVDPFIYGFGIAHIRRSIFGNLRALKQFLADMLH